MGWKRGSFLCGALVGTLLGVLSAEPPSAAESQQQVSRLPPLSQPYDPFLQGLFDQRRKMGGGGPLNSELTTGHAPKLMKAARDMAFALRNDTVTPRNLRELAIVRTADLLGADYELFHHKAFMKMCGYSDQQVAAVADWQGSKLFNDKERAILAFVDGMANAGNVDDKTFATLQTYFSPQEIVEIAMTVKDYYGVGLMVKALKVKTDDHTTVAGKC